MFLAYHFILIQNKIRSILNLFYEFIVIWILIDEILEVFFFNDVAKLLFVWSVDDVTGEVFHVVANMILGF